MIDARSSVRRRDAAPLATGTPAWATGMMSGTSMDGLDLALIKTDGEVIDAFGPVWSQPIWPGLGAELASSLTRIAEIDTATLSDPGRWPDWLQQLQHRITAFHGWAVEGFRLDEGLGEVGEGIWNWVGQHQRSMIMGVHGQTVIHRPEDGFTLQLFDPDRLPDGSRAFEVVSDFRSGDMQAGGQGAPLAPFFHFALARHIEASAPVAFLNIGGVANVTWIDPSKELPEEPGALMAFDTGPGNALINDWMLARTGAPMDADGAAAGSGRVQGTRLASNTASAYLGRVPPKSLDRNDFGPVLGAMEGLLVEDGAATLTAFTVDCIVESLRHMPIPPSRWLVCGGGRLNATMMRMLSDRMDAPVEPVEAVGLDGDMLEAQAFAYLAVRVLRGLPTSAPTTTGCREPVCGGRITCPGV